MYLNISICFFCSGLGQVVFQAFGTHRLSIKAQLLLGYCSAGWAMQATSTTTRENSADSAMISNNLAKIEVFGPTWDFKSEFRQNLREKLDIIYTEFRRIQRNSEKLRRTEKN